MKPGRVAGGRFVVVCRPRGGDPETCRPARSRRPPVGAPAGAKAAHQRHASPGGERPVRACRRSYMKPGRVAGGGLVVVCRPRGGDPETCRPARSRRPPVGAPAGAKAAHQPAHTLPRGTPGSRLPALLHEARPRRGRQVRRGVQAPGRRSGDMPACPIATAPCRSAGRREGGASAARKSRRGTPGSRLSALLHEARRRRGWRAPGAGWFAGAQSGMAAPSATTTANRSASAVSAATCRAAASTTLPSGAGRARVAVAAAGTVTA